MQRLPLHEGARHRAQPGGREQIAGSGRIDDVDLVLKVIAAIGERIAQHRRVEPRGIVDVEAGGVDLELAQAAELAGDRAVDAVDLGLIGDRLRPVDVAIEVEQPVVGPVVAVACRGNLVLHPRVEDRQRVGRPVRLAGLVIGLVGDAGKFDFVPRRRAHRQLADRRRDVERGVGPLLFVAVEIVRILSHHPAGEHVDVRIHSRARKHRAHAAHEVGSEHASGQHAPALAGLDDVFDVLGAERTQAASYRWAAP